MNKPNSAVLRRGSQSILTVALIAVLVALCASAAYALTFTGTSADEDFVGTPQTDRATMKGGDDTAQGLGRADSLFGNTGNDELDGGQGTDEVDGGTGNDLLVGGIGEDELVGSDGDDTIYTGTLEDGDKVSDEVQCGDGHDVVFLSGGDHASHNNQRDKCEEINHY